MARDINQLHIALKNVALKLVEECKKQGLNIKITECLRSKEEQDALYAQGRTKSGKIVTNAKFGSSYHNFGLAFDICNNNKNDAYNVEVLKKAGAIGKNLGLTWGGDFKSIKDYPHFEYNFGLNLSQLRAGIKPPAVAYINENFKPNSEFISSIEKLSSKGYINSKDYWLNNSEYSNDFFKELIIKVTKKHCFKDAIEYLAENRIINSKEYWLNNNDFSTENIRSMIIKIANEI